MEENTLDVREENEEDSNSESYSSESDVETEVTNRQLQDAFADGLLQPGLNFIDKPVKECANDVGSMKDILQEFTQNIDWIERLDVTCGPVHPPGMTEEEKNEEFDVEDYFKRELRFYRQAQAAALEALPKLNKMDVQTRRPEDYFAEMAKSDVQMKKIREKLLKRQMSLDKSEKAKKLREMRKFGKKVQQEVLHARQKEKTEMTRRVKNISKGKMQETGEELKKQQEKGKRRNQDPKGKNPNNPLTKKVNKKREYKNSKFGFGGKTRRMKFNDKDSHGAEEDGFDARRNQQSFSKQRMKKGGFKKGKGGGFKKGQGTAAGGIKKPGMKKGRPGKNKRKTMKSRRK
ncbi:putative rRNA-processing protein EBP2 [Apostichopus japonicus]|uniref:Putative rRNA-processing protein EBP2 n=1 Tax=Stichopus japonicus TaxID=307972 RepID=A0A2G8L097_STIJA|nr:putative rRNA-processing protein EBP2 [Apostichopus japonicus]